MQLIFKITFLSTDETDTETGEDTKIECTICQEYVKPGVKLYHCTLCPDDAGFNACANCYSPFAHDGHGNYIESGIYPEYNPLGEHKNLNGVMLASEREINRDKKTDTKFQRIIYSGRRRIR